MAFQCILVTPEQQTLDAKVVQTIIPAHDGMVGIMTDRAPLMAKLGTGPMRVDLADGRKAYYFIDGGFAEMKDNKLTILTNEAKTASEIDFEAARAAEAEALARKITSEKSFDERQHMLQRARGLQQMADLK